jgi:hypothetical protein
MEQPTKDLIPEKRILSIILVIRGRKVILDSDLATLYGVETRRLNEQVRRNIDKFPEDFMFQLARELCKVSKVWWGVVFCRLSQYIKASG